MASIRITLKSVAIVAVWTFLIAVLTEGAMPVAGQALEESGHTLVGSLVPVGYGCDCDTIFTTGCPGCEEEDLTTCMGDELPWTTNGTCVLRLDAFHQPITQCNAQECFPQVRGTELLDCAPG